MNNRKHYHWNTHINQTHNVFLIPNYSPHHHLNSIHFFLFSALSLFQTNTPQSRNTQRRHIEHLQHPLQVLPILHRYIQRLLPIARHFHDLSLLLHLLPHSPHSLPLLRLHRRLRLVFTVPRPPDTPDRSKTSGFHTRFRTRPPTPRRRSCCSSASSPASRPSAEAA